MAVVVVNLDGARDLPACIRAFRAQDVDELDLLVVDNASRDDSLAVLRALATEPGRHPLRVIANRTNRGYAGGANDGLAATEAPVVVVANPDVVPAPDYVRRATVALLADDRRWAVQGRLVRARGAPLAGRLDTTGHVAFSTRLFRNRGEGAPPADFDRAGPIFGVSGALSVLRRRALDDLALPGDGGRAEVFAERLFAFFEDVELDWRAQLRGWEAWYEPTAAATHERGGAGPRRTALVERLNWRNRLLVIVACDDGRALLRAAPGVAATTVLKTIDLALTHPTALVRGLGDLVRALPWAWRRRRLVGRRATVPRREVVDRWFGPFDWRAWVRTWWQRVTTRR